MLNLSRTGLIATITSIALLAVACTPKEGDKAAAATPASTNEAVAATVNGSPILKKEVDMIMKQQRGLPDTPETRKMIIDNLAMQMIVAQEAVKKGLDKAPDTLGELAMARQSVLAQAFVQDYVKQHPITDAQLTAEYDKLKAQAESDKPGNQYKARHILVKTEDEAKAIIAKLNKDVKSFDGLAKAQSLDPGSKAKGGDLGWFDSKTMVPEFSAAVAKLEKGKFTETPVKSQYGYHVIILDDVRPSTASAPTIPPLEQIKTGLTQQMQQQELKKMLDEMKGKAKIDIVAAAPAPAPAVTPAPAAKPEAAATPAPAEAAK